MSKNEKQNVPNKHQLKKTEKQKKKQERMERYSENKEMFRVGYFLVAIFIGMLGYFIWFEAIGREAVASNPLNNRYDVASSRIIRGNIQTADGTIIAQTVEGEDGSQTRIYPYSDIYGTITGYTAMGKTGLEESQNRFLMNANLDMLTVFKNEISETKSQGDVVVTTLDADLQMFCYQLLGEKNGSITVMEPATGKILAMVSKPGYDPNTVLQNWDALISPDNTSGNLMNRSTQGLYAPGSTFKIITAMEYMREHPDDYQNFTYTCTGSYEYQGNVFSCSEGHVHGTETLKEALANSCNCFFAEMGRQLDPVKWKAFCEELGFNKKLDFVLVNNASRFEITKDSSTWDMLQTSFGQGQTMETPLQNLVVTAMVANEGTMMTPYLIDHIENSEGKVIETYAPVEGEQLISASQAEDMNEYLKAVIDLGGSAYSTTHSDIVTIAGKTGSAQYSASLEDLNTWFTAYAPAEKPEIAVTIMVENGGGAASNLGPLIKQLMEYYFTRSTQ